MKIFVLKIFRSITWKILFRCLQIALIYIISKNTYSQSSISPTQRISIHDSWRFMRYTGQPDSLFYDEHPSVTKNNVSKVADTRATEAHTSIASQKALKAWVLPTANDFIEDPSKHYNRPAGNPGKDFAFVQTNFDDNAWEPVTLPHDWAISQPFYKGEPAVVGGGMGRLPVQGVAWYRKKLDIPKSDAGKTVYLDIDGAMSYTIVWLNGNLVGGCPYGYNSFRPDLTPYIKYGGDNQFAIRIDNPNYSSRWYPGAGIYRNVWLTKVDPVHVAQWGTTIQTKNITAASATVDLSIKIENASAKTQAVKIITEVFALDGQFNKTGKPVTVFPSASINIKAKQKNEIKATVVIQYPLLWGTPPSQKPNLYTAVITVYSNGKAVDKYETQFGIRSVFFDTVKGLLVNGEPVRMQGVNQHHDLGALGAAFNYRAAERQLQMLAEMGCNAILMAHNPPAPELLDFTDRMGFLVIDEVFDYREKGKNPHDFHLIFNEWYEADVRSFISRDKNHPSIISWSFGNEVGEQYTAEAGAAPSKKIYDIVKDEDSVMHSADWRW